MAKKTTPTQKLSSWFLSSPVKFAFLSFGLMAGLTLIYAFIVGLVTGGHTTPATMSPWLLITLTGGALVYSIYKYIKWLPSDNLDRRSFVAIDNGLTFIYFLSLFLSTIFIISSTQKIMLYAMWLQYYSMLLFFFVVIAISIIYMYVLGLLIGNMYATYRRALGMGVPRHKALLTLPFSIAMFWFPGYLLEDNTKTKPVIAIKSKWYSQLTDWVVAKPLNAVLLFLLTFAFSFIFFDIQTLCLTLFFGTIFGVWLLCTGAKKLKKNIGGAYSTLAGAINIAFIIVCIGFIAYFSTHTNTSVNQIQYESIQITEVIE